MAALLLVLLVVAGVGALLVASDRRGTRIAALTVALTAFLNAAIWSTVMPAFNAPDEAAHYAYVESLGEHHRLPYKDPTAPGGSYSAEALLAIQLTALHVTQHPEIKLPWTRLEQAGGPVRTRRFASGGPISSAAATQRRGVLALLLRTRPARVPRGERVGRLHQGRDDATRLGLLAGLTALAAFLFVRELFPTRTWAAASAA